MTVVIDGTKGVATPSGSAGSPSHADGSFVNGLYFPTSTSAALATNGAVAVTISSSQQFMLGTTVAQAKATIIQSGGTALGSGGNLALGAGDSDYLNTILRIDNSATNSFCIDQKVGGVWYNRLYIERTSGNIGFGTSSPDSNLIIDGGAIGKSRFYYNNTSINYIDVNTHVFRSAASAEYMRIDSAGNLGLGVTPSAWSVKGFQISGNGTSISSVDGTDITFSAYYNSGWKYQNSTYAAAKYTQDSTGKHIWFNAPSGTAGNPITFTQAMTLDASGKLLVGTTTANGTITVSGNITATGGATWLSGGYMYLNNTDDTQASFLRDAGSGGSSALIFATNSAEKMRLDSSGNFALGTTATTNQRFTIASNGASAAGNAFYVYNSTPVALFTIRNDGAMYSGTAPASPYNLNTASAANMYVDSGGVLYRSTSSLRYKTDIQNATHGLSDVLNLRSVTYKGKNDGDKVFGGLIAEEVDAAGLTEFVVYDSEGRPDALHYGNMAGLFVKAIQELAAKVAALEGTK